MQDAAKNANSSLSSSVKMGYISKLILQIQAEQEEYFYMPLELHWKLQ